MSRLLLRRTASTVVGNCSSQIVDCRWCCSLACQGQLSADDRTFVLTIRSFRGLLLGLSPAPTTATSDVQNSISTIDAAPSSAAT